MTNDNNYKIKPLEKFGFFGFSTATNIAFNFKSMYYLIFLDVICGLGPGLAGLILSIGTVWDAVNDPLIALFCENHRFKNGEKSAPMLSTLPSRGRFPSCFCSSTSDSPPKP